MVSLNEVKRSFDIAARHRWVQQMDREYLYRMSRGVTGYENMLLGFKHMLEYLRTHSSEIGSNILVDIGAGWAHFAADLAGPHKSLGSGLNVISTVSDKSLVCPAMKDSPQLIEAFVEDLSNLPTPLAGVLGTHSIAYTVAPELAVAQLDQHLGRYGVIKMTCRSDREINPISGSHRHMQKAGTFAGLLARRGYGVALYDAANDPYEPREILLAVKNRDTQFAEHLLQQDLRDYQVGKKLII